MSLTEIKKEADHLTAEESMYLATWFRHKARRKDSAYLASLDSAWEAMEEGDRVSLDDYRRLSADLDRSGL